MSKKKSYMNLKGIINEGLLDDLLRAIIPKSIQKSMNFGIQLCMDFRAQHVAKMEPNTLAKSIKNASKN